MKENRTIVWLVIRVNRTNIGRRANYIVRRSVVAKQLTTKVFIFVHKKKRTLVL